MDPLIGKKVPPVTGPENVGLPVRFRLPAPLTRPEKLAWPNGSLIVYVPLTEAKRSTEGEIGTAADGELLLARARPTGW